MIERLQYEPHLTPSGFPPMAAKAEFWSSASTLIDVSRKLGKQCGPPLGFDLRRNAASRLREFVFLSLLSGSDSFAHSEESSHDFLSRLSEIFH